MAQTEDDEWMALDRFRDVSGLLSGTATPVDADPPDFLIIDGTRRVAVEMTRYHYDSSADGSQGAKREALEKRVLAAAQTCFEESWPNVCVSVSPYFREGSLRRGNVPDVAKRLAKLVAQIIPSEPSDAERMTSNRADWDMFDSAGLGEFLIDLNVYRWRKMSASQWQAPVGGYMNTDVASIERRLRSKEEDLALYKAKFDECWLIIHAPVLHASSFFDFEVLTPYMFASDFDRVVFIDVHLGKFELIA